MTPNNLAYSVKSYIFDSLINCIVIAHFIDSLTLLDSEILYLIV